MHRTLKRILRVLCLEAIPDWEKILPQALFALRTVRHDSTGFSPAELVHGKTLWTPVKLLYEKLTKEEPVESSVVDYVFELINRMKRCHRSCGNPTHGRCQTNPEVVHDEEEDTPSLELENERLGWSKITSDVQLNSKLSQIPRGQLKELLYEYSNLFSNIPGCTDLAEHDIELESERAIVLLSLICNASNLGIGVVLSQVCENEEHPIMFLSKTLSLAEQKYSTTEKECAAIIFAVQKLKCYLEGHQKFVPWSVKIILDRVISDRKERERSKLEEKKGKTEVNKKKRKNEISKKKGKKEVNKKKEKGKEKSEWLERPDNTNYN
ncbi:retrovirus-related Pol polyprotein from transposon 412 [Trichonephila clavipes]|nr:retrovirus-related Pol polyprotein from transposon 412 [Trichonephila clavipes]